MRFARTTTTTGEPSAIVLALKAGQFVSKIKTLQDKKRLSYEHDRRNTYGENQKSSRKNIPRSKQLSHQDERRSVRQALIAAQGDITEDVADEAQSQALQKGSIKKLNAFRKSADRPLGKSSSVDCAGRRAEMIIIRKRIGAGEAIGRSVGRFIGRSRARRTAGFPPLRIRATHIPARRQESVLLPPQQASPPDHDLRSPKPNMLPQSAQKFEYACQPTCTKVNEVVRKIGLL